ncbi:MULTISPECIES: tyrosine-type recombinase/integrase [Paenibacillus]|uniref:tyrosine-type recombinase/integrase n=1 Tax=Paenibacillus TaxID=44249 RepID=UPI0021160380|nr:MULTISPECIES: tyrosine-type recombinase/integrase [Paenibacillus]
MPKSTLFNAFQRIIKRAELNEDLEIHSLPHTYAVPMLEAGEDIKFVQEQLGHGKVCRSPLIYMLTSPKS